MLEYSRTAFVENFKFKGHTGRQVAVTGIDNSGFSRADANPQHGSPVRFQLGIPVASGPAELVASPDVLVASGAGTIEVPANLNTNASRTRSRSPVRRGDHTMPQRTTAPSASRLLTVQPQIAHPVIAAASYSELRFLAAQPL